MRTTGRLFHVLLALAGLRVVVYLLALPLIPLLYREHFAFLVLMRPTKEIFLVGGFLIRRGDVSLWPVLLAAVPLGVLGVWHLYLLGRFFGRWIVAGEVPRWATRILPPDRLARLQAVLHTRGWGVVFLGRIAVFPSTLVGAAAGSAGVAPRKFLGADLAGAAVSTGSMIGLGYALNFAHARAGPWVAGAGAVAVFGMAFLLGRYLRTASEHTAPAPEPEGS